MPNGNPDSLKPEGSIGGLTPEELARMRADGVV